jgi:hypothetical protein
MMIVLYKICGALLMLAGLPLFLTPIPVGAIMIAAGLTLYVAHSPRSRALVRHLRGRWSWFDSFINGVCRVSPKAVSAVLGRTACHREACEAEHEMQPIRVRTK